MYPFSQGLPGSMNSVFIPSRFNQPVTASAVNSGLSLIQEPSSRQELSYLPSVIGRVTKITIKAARRLGMKA